MPKKLSSSVGKKKKKKNNTNKNTNYKTVGNQF